ncbi:aminotransferase class I/II-fold pyridoxal phosphate-dependent enzyme [Candidatus Gracilibacteria bacterium]|nr:aminotransferase class I/II-fold pyridoxal phosphate-dependent enzyme [Candidatus Gracilibacteria bacterium]
MIPLFPMTLNPQAVQLNDILEKCNPALLRLLSRHGREMFFPKADILKQTADAKGKKINATIGIALADDGSPMYLPSLAQYVKLDPKEYIPYAPAYGVQKLRETWAKLLREKNPTLGQKMMTCPIVTSGMTNALAIAGYLWGNPGEKIILSDKFWGNYRGFFERNFDMEFSCFNTFQDGHFDLESFEQKLAEDGVGKKIVLINMPNNPSGYTVTEEEAKQVMDILKRSAESGNELVVICDDAYFGLVFEEGVLTESLFGYLADLHENILAVKVDGLTKEEYMWGFRVGFLTCANKNLTPEAVEALENKIVGSIRSTVSNCSLIAQNLALHAFESPTYASEKKKNFETLRGRYIRTKEVLEKNKEKYAEFFSPLPFDSGYFLCIEMKQVDPEAVRQKLLADFDTGIISTGNMIRIATSACPVDKIEELFENIYQASKISKVKC